MIVEHSIPVFPIFIGGGERVVTLTAALIGFLGGIISTFGIYLIRKRERKEKLRKSLLSELKIPKEIIEEVAEMGPEEVSGIESPKHTGIPTSIYDSHIDDLGLLTSHELDPIIRYYSSAKVASEQLNNFDNTASKKSFVEETAPILKEARDEAENEIETCQKRFSSVRRGASKFGDVIKQWR